MSRAVVFDLDETLYPERRFLLSGFLAVADEVRRRFDVPRAGAFQVLRRALARDRGTALQELCAAYRLPTEVVADLVAVIRSHRPRLRLPRESADVLRTLRRSWKVGVLTNGVPDIQARKIAALGLSDRVDAVVFALDSGELKPEPAPFRAILDRLGASPDESVFVGDDPWCDVFGARRIGMRTIRVRRGAHSVAPVAPASDADATVRSLRHVPALAAELLAEVHHHVA